MQNYDVAIIGAGMIGLTLAVALNKSGMKVVVIDAQQQDETITKQPLARVSAINLASQRIFENLEVWPSIQSERLQPYQHMQVWEQDSFANINFTHQDIQRDHLGSIVENQVVRQGLLTSLQDSPNVEMMIPAKVEHLVFGQSESFMTLSNGNTLTAKLVVGADGANSMVRRVANLPLTFWDYEHLAIVATVKTQLPHGNTARQVFTPSGPLAFLPLFEENLCSIVWSQEVSVAENLLALEDKAFNHALSAAFDTKLGQVELVSDRTYYPLTMRYCRSWLKDRVMLIGDAAHTIHPLAGQGANLGIADAAALAQTLIKLFAQSKDIGLAKNLRAVERWRKTEAMKMIATMEGFKRLFSGNHPIKKLVRGIGLSATDQMGPVKRDIIKHAVGLGGELPDLAK
ncbi:FAD-dependent oxidoreductase [Aliiglaciecola sp. LCG003]|uniref:FAD-dependent oxidoreductase n=1 Tax=Aliiglaciecola sp. LCG003 TaxID=3053655 RepID=UPI002573CE39|nr:FAD-dependent oxidoreductase [Aliiglaciecola sp. LCG003]WJG10230.1 FAD-dependent oxidoreductase [Aliiglaciecola sp. LCG003]